MSTAQVETFTGDDVADMSRHADELAATLRVLRLAGLEGSDRYAQLSGERRAIREALSAHRRHVQGLDDARREQERANRKRTARIEAQQQRDTEAAAQFLEPLLSGGPIREDEIYDRAGSEGIDRASVTAAASRLGAVRCARYGAAGRIRNGDPRYWSLTAMQGMGFGAFERL